MSHRRLLLTAIFTLNILFCIATEPAQTDFSYWQCQGSLMPYPAEVQPTEIPDSLQAVMINHVGRHGARYPASAANCVSIKQALMKADSLGTITDTGRQLLEVTNNVILLSEGRWGALDSLGETEQRGIATRMYNNFPDIFKNAGIASISSYSPRCMMSMYAFTHELDRLNNHLNFITTTGAVNNLMLRPFQIDDDYLEFRRSQEVKQAYDEYFNENCPTAAIQRALGDGYPYSNEEEKKELAIKEYYVVAGLSAMGLQCNPERYFTAQEYYSLWSCFNMRQYLQRTETCLSDIPARIAAPLLEDLITSTDAFIEGIVTTPVLLRFGHAETIMPLLSLMRLPGCYYVSNNLKTVAEYWQDFHVVPMAANLQLILFRSDTGNYYIRIDLNETPVALPADSGRIYIPWNEAKTYFMQNLE